MKSSIHTFYIQNGMPVHRRYYLPSLAEGHTVVYEVIRLVEGVPLFFKAHYRRMKRSARLIGKHFHWTMSDIEKSVRRLIEVNRVTYGNVKIMVQWEEEDDSVLYACFIPFHYPSDCQLENGVPVGLLAAERSNPNAKVIDRSIREKADRLIREKNYYEVILVNEEGYLTEGSRSNFFIISQGRISTPPVKVALPGITRDKVMSLARELGLTVEERPISREELPEVEAAFITGTSPGVLPISDIDAFCLNTNMPLLKKLQTSYQKLMRKYVRSHRTLCLGETV